MWIRSKWVMASQQPFLRVWKLCTKRPGLLEMWLLISPLTIFTVRIRTHNVRREFFRQGLAYTYIYLFTYLLWFFFGPKRYRIYEFTASASTTKNNEKCKFTAHHPHHTYTYIHRYICRSLSTQICTYIIYISHPVDHRHRHPPTKMEIRQTCREATKKIVDVFFLFLRSLCATLVCLFIILIYIHIRLKWFLCFFSFFFYFGFSSSTKHNMYTIK